MDKNKERMNNIEKQVEYFVETYGHAPEEASKKICALFSVTKRWLFWFESEGKDGWTFTIKAKNSDEAYDLAYEEYGPQVEGMMYQEI